MESKLLEKLIKEKTKFCVKVNNDAEKDKLLSLYNNYDDIRWICSGRRPIEFSYHYYPYYIYLNIDKKISWSNECSSKSIEIKLDDLFNSLSKQEIHITRKDNEVHAILKENDKVIKRTVAKCHPEDEFDFKVGSKLVYDRLFEKDNEDEKSENTETNKPKHEFKVGDKVRIRQWDDMAEQFGLDEEGDIKIPYPDLVVSAKFKHLCGKTGKIINIENGNIYFKPFDDTGIFCYLPCILEPYTPRVAKVGEYVKILKTGKIVKCDHDTEYWGEKIFKCDEGDCIYLKPEEYEVLDDYIPPLNCRFIPTKDTMGLTKGKIYEVKNGKFKDDDGDIFPMFEELLNEEDLKKYFLPLMEDSEIIIVIKD